MHNSVRMQLLSAGFAALVSVTAIACSLGGTEPTTSAPEPPTPRALLFVQPSVSAIAQGDSGVFAVRIVALESGGLVEVNVTGAPVGVIVSVTDKATTGFETTAMVRIKVAADAALRTDSLHVRAIRNGVLMIAETVLLTVFADPLCPSNGVVCAQWARSAAASSQYTPGDWSASAATGVPNVNGCSDDVRAWASVEANGVDWLELTYEKPVIPTEINVYENYGVSSIVKVEIVDLVGASHTVFVAEARRESCPRVLRIPVTFSSPVVGVRISLDQRVINDWNEIDAVFLIGKRP